MDHFFSAVAACGGRRTFAVIGSLGLLMVFTGGCQNSGAAQQSASQAAVAGQTLCDSALKFYNDVDALAVYDRHQQDFIEVVIDPTPDTIVPHSPLPPFAEPLASRRAAFGQLRQAYEEFQKLADPAFQSDTSTAIGKLTDSLNTVKGIPNIDSSIKELATQIGGQIIAQIQAGEIRTQSQNLMRLTDLYATLWDSDSPLWTNDIDRVERDAASGLASLPAAAFVDAPLASKVGQPFSKNINVGLYKLSLRDDATTRATALTDELHAVSRSFKSLHSAHAELAKTNPSLAVVQYNLDTVNALLKSVPNSK